jgi:hypothetical protein
MGHGDFDRGPAERLPSAAWGSRVYFKLALGGLDISFRYAPLARLNSRVETIQQNMCTTETLVEKKILHAVQYRGELFIEK